MSPFTALHAPVTPPPWCGASRFYVLSDQAPVPVERTRHAKRINPAPFLLVRPGTQEEAAMLARGNWWPKPKETDE